eukprot:7127741-Pyramimonas_sp.AAC.1
MIRNSGKGDRTAWLEEYAAGGGWETMQFLRKPRTVNKSAIKKPDGTLSDTAERAHIMADYFETVQWRLQHPELKPETQAPISGILPVRTRNLTMDELRM